MACLIVTTRLSFVPSEPSTQPVMSTPPFQGCRRKTLKYINSRTVLIAICTLVVIECACVLAELMVDLQGIKFRFENEEQEILRFVQYLKNKYPAQFASFEGRNVEDIFNQIQEAVVLKSPDDFSCLRCPCTCPTATQTESSSVTLSANGDTSSGNSDTSSGNSDALSASSDTSRTRTLQQSVISRDPQISAALPLLEVADLLAEQQKAALSRSQSAPSNTPSASQSAPSNTPVALSSTAQLVRVDNTTTAAFKIEDVFVLEINNVKESFFLVAEYAPEHIAQNDTRHSHYYNEYDKIHQASTMLHIGSLVILSVMVIETLAKLVCMGTGFLKKRFEVFDAFIVLASFALDFVFLDSRWYETGKDAATILVLLLPWRVVRIVNSFLMTIKHKHHIEMMNMKRAKKKADFKNAKLQTLLTEIRKDVQLLVALCRNSHLPEGEITACLYGLGRRSTTLNAVTSCTTIMLVSALGKDAYCEDEIYGRLFADALRDPTEHEDEPEAKKAQEEAIDAAIELDKQLELKNKKAARACKPRSGKRRGKVTRSYTVPRRSASLDNQAAACEAEYGDVPFDSVSATTGSGSIFYVNNGFTTHKAQRTAGAASCSGATANGGQSRSPETLAGLASGSGIPLANLSPTTPNGEEEVLESPKESWEERLPPKYQSKASVRSVPGRGSNYVTFEVTTQVTYL